MEPPRKQRRIRRVPLACLPCRARKTRCDGRQPICIACESRGAAGRCRYELNPNKRPPDQEPALLAPNRTIAVSAPSRDLGSEAVVSPARHHGHNSMDGLATVPSYCESDALFGPSSTVAFSRSLDPELTSRETEGASARSSTQRRLSSRQHHLRHRDGPMAMLPRRRNADGFLRCFWDFIHPVFPILHKPAFLAQYHELWSSTEPCPTGDGASHETDDIVFITILNLVFALGSKFSDGVAPARREEVADGFYERA